MTFPPPQFQGLDRFECRQKLLGELTESGALVATTDHVNSVGHCYRCHTTVEPYLSTQWFVKMDTLVQPAIQAIEDGTVRLIPKRWDKVYFDWMSHIRPWCISRQIWWGHRIPAWYCANHPDTPLVAITAPAACPTCGSTDLSQDTDVLDTWFSSALWPFSTLGWPNETTDLARFYPTQFLVTGYDIITFWVSRMMTMGLFNTGKAPFSEVYIHGLIRDIHGKKMSKSLGNAIDPIELIDRFGSDALRFSLASLSTMGGQDIRFSEDHVESCRNFCNKLWNASRFVWMNLQDVVEPIDLEIDPTTAMTRWTLSHLAATVETVDRALSECNFALAADTLWEFGWNTFCDWTLEMSKLDRQTSLPMVVYTLVQLLILLHPFIPTITEEIWKIFRESGKVNGLTSQLMTTPWVTNVSTFRDLEIEAEMGFVIKVIRDIRNLRKTLNLNPGVEVEVVIRGSAEDEIRFIQNGGTIINRLAKVKSLTVIASSDPSPTPATSSVVQQTEIFVLMTGLVDLDAERERLTKRLAKVATEIATIDAKRQNPTFLEKAPAAIVTKLGETHALLVAEHDLLQTKITAL